MTKLLPKDLEVLDRRQEKEKEEKEAREKEKEAKKENAGSKKKDPSNSKDANTGGDAAAGGTDAGAEGTEEPEQAPARRPNPIPYIIIGLVLLQIHMDDILSLLGLRAKPGRPVFSTNQDQPLWGKTEYFIPGQRLKDMQGGLQQHAWSTPGVRGYRFALARCVPAAPPSRYAHPDARPRPLVFTALAPHPSRHQLRPGGWFPRQLRRAWAGTVRSRPRDTAPRGLLQARSAVGGECVVDECLLGAAGHWRR